jgi:hypothetical protein
MGLGAKSYMHKDFHHILYEEVVINSYMTLHPVPIPLNFLIYSMRKILFSFLSVCGGGGGGYRPPVKSVVSFYPSFTIRKRLIQPNILPVYKNLKNLRMK